MEELFKFVKELNKLSHTDNFIFYFSRNINVYCTTGILRDKTMDDKLINILIFDKQNNWLKI